MHSNLAPTIDVRWNERHRLSYLEAGTTGPVVLLLHGWGAFKELWWSTLIGLSVGYRLIALDLPGHGDSPLSRLTTMDGTATQIADFCAELGLQQIVVVGHSMGGNIAVELALAHPTLVQSLILVDAAIDTDAMPSYIRVYTAGSYGWAMLRFGLLSSQWMQPLGKRVPNLHGGGWIRPWLRRTARLADFDPGGLRRSLVDLCTNPLSGRVDQLAVPTLVISGQFDSLVPSPLSRQVAQQIRGARYIEIPGALHNPMDERPKLFEQALKGFLGEHRPEPASHNNQG